MDAGPVVAPLGQQLIDAANQGNIELVGALLDQGVAVDSRGDFHRTPLMRASEFSYRAVASLLLDRGANVNADSAGGYTPAAVASVNGHLDTLLVSRGANFHRRSQSGHSSLFWAAMYDRLPVCKYLLSVGADLMALMAKANVRVPALYLYRHYVYPCISPATAALRRAALKAALAAGPHPSQVQRRRDERWFRRGPLLRVLAEHAYRPLQLRALAIALAAASLDPAAPIEAVALTTKEQRVHAFLLGRVFSNEGIVRLLVGLL